MNEGILFVVGYCFIACVILTLWDFFFPSKAEMQKIRAACLSLSWCITVPILFVILVYYGVYKFINFLIRKGMNE